MTGRIMSWMKASIDVMVDRITSFLDRLFNQYKFVRRFLIFWFIGMVSLIGINSILHPEGITEYSSSVQMSIVTLAAIVFGLYQWLRERDQ